MLAVGDITRSPPTGFSAFFAAVPVVATPPLLGGDECVMTGHPFNGPMGCGGDHPWLSRIAGPPEIRLIGLLPFFMRDPVPMLGGPGGEFCVAREEWRGEREGCWGGEVCGGGRDLGVAVESGLPLEARNPLLSPPSSRTPRSEVLCFLVLVTVTINPAFWFSTAFGASEIEGSPPSCSASPS